MEKSPVMDDFSICIGFGHWLLAYLISIPIAL